MVRIQGTQHTVNPGNTKLVLKGVSSKSGVISLKVQLEMIFKTISVQESKSSSRVEVVLVLGRLFRFGFNQELGIKPDLLSVINRHMIETGEIIKLKFHICI
ncbi:hypothetical protein D3C81_1922660 [compost metagenome]